MNYFLYSGLLLCSLILSACNGKSSPPVEEDSLLSARVAMQANIVKSREGFNDFNSRLIKDSIKILSRAETMLQSMYDNRDRFIDIMEALESPFLITTAEDISIDNNVSSTNPPFIIGAGGLTDDFLLLSSSSRFLTAKNTIKTRFTSPAELDVAWLRAVEFSDGVCVYVTLQSVDVSGVVTSASNVLVVPLVSADQCSV